MTAHSLCSTPRVRSRFAVSVLTILALTLSALMAGSAAQARAATQSVEGELLVGFRVGVGASTRQALFRDLGVTHLEDFEHGTGLVRIKVPRLALVSVIRGLARRHDVRFVEKNEVLETALVPDDPQYASQWHLVKINAPQAWDLTQGASSAVVAIVDSGVDTFHPDLTGKLVAGFNSYDKSANTADQFGHGTKMAGVAGARSNNGVGIAGVAGLAPIMPIRATDRSGRATSASIAKGIFWATDHGARVVNVSLEGVARNATIRAAAEYAYQHGVLVVAPSGNCGCVDSTPATPFILTVSATDENDRVATFSSTGAFVNVSAPGVNIPTTAMYGLYLSDSGTSLSSSIVAGVAALMFSANPALTAAHVMQLLEKTATRPGGIPGYDQSIGYGRIDAFAAVKAAAAHVPSKVVSQAVSVITSGH